MFGLLLPMTVEERVLITMSWPFMAGNILTIVKVIMSMGMGQRRRNTLTFLALCCTEPCPVDSPEP